MRLADTLFNAYCADHNASIAWFADYAEPGYTAGEKGILIADWNSEERAYKIARRLDYSVAWSDEWIECEQCHKLVRSKPDSYTWLPSYISLAEGIEIICKECYEYRLDVFLEDTLREVDNTMYRCLPAWFKEEWMRNAGYHQHGEEQETGFYPGQRDEPQLVLRQLLPYFTSVVFQATSQGQFDFKWIIWVKE